MVTLSLERIEDREMSKGPLVKLSSIDAHLRLLAPGKVSEDDKLVEYDALLLDRFLDIVQDLHGDFIRETVTFFFVLLLVWYFFPTDERDFASSCLFYSFIMK